MNRRKQEWLALLLAAIVLLTCLSLLTALFTPRNHDFGSTWGSFLKEQDDSIDVMFFGSSIVFCDVVPAVFWEGSGLSAYVNGGAEQPLSITLAYVEQSLKTQSPRAIFVECSGLCFADEQAHIKTNIGQMPWGLARLKATLCVAAPENREGLLFPLSFYHDRWSMLTDDDVTAYTPDPLAGYTFLDEYSGEGPDDAAEIPVSEAVWEKNTAQLEKIYALCQKKGITLVLYRAPARRLEDADWQTLTAAYAGRPGVCTLDCRDFADEIGTVAPTDYYDSLHFNAAGADKFSAFLARWAQENLALTPSPDTDADLWQARLTAFRTRLATPMQERRAAS